MAFKQIVWLSICSFQFSFFNGAGPIYFSGHKSFLITQTQNGSNGKPHFNDDVTS